MPAAMQPPARTLDVLAGTKSFAGLLLPPPIEQALREAGFRRPSPVQEAALPLARAGAPLLVQAKAGTGKTLVFAVAAVERVDLANGAPQVLVLAPTREIALQASETVALVAAALPPPGLACGTFIGGLPVEEDEKQLRRSCHVAVGTTGRLLSLIQRGALRTDAVLLLVLDEADKLLADSFRPDTLAIVEAVPPRRQLLALSATYQPAALAHLRRLMGGRQQEVLLSAEDTSLMGVRQCYKLLRGEAAGGEAAAHEPRQEQQAAREQRRRQQHAGQPAAGAEQHPGSSAEQLEPRVAALLHLLGAVSFQQAVVFCNYRADAEAVAGRLAAAGHPATFLSAQRTQLQRIEALNALRDFKLRVAVTTDVAARGVDLERVNLVVNLALPPDAATYMHRVGRAGRFGTRGVAVTLLRGQRELVRLEAYLAEVAGGQVSELPELVPDEWYRQAAPTPGAAIVHSTHARASPGMGPSTPASSPLLAAHAADSWGSSGGQGALADIASASLWVEEEQAAGEEEVEEALLATAQPPPPPQQLEGLEEDGGVDISHVVVPRPTASSARRPVAAAPASPPRPAVSSLTASLAAAANGGAAEPADEPCSSVDSDADSWASSSDDNYSGSSGSDGEYATAATAVCAATPCPDGRSGSGGPTLPPVSFKPLRRVGSAASSVSSASSGGSGARLSSPPAPIPGRQHHALQQEAHRPLWVNSYEDGSTGLADAVAEAPASLADGDAADAGSARPPAADRLMGSSDEEPSFRDSWLNEEQQAAVGTEKVRRRQEEAAAAAATSFELRPYGRGSQPADGKAAKPTGALQRARQGRTQQGHYWDVVRSVRQDVQSRQPTGGTAAAPAAVPGQSAAGQREKEEGQGNPPAVPRHRRPLGSAQASAARRREEEASAAQAAEEAEARALEHITDSQDCGEATSLASLRADSGAASAAAAEQQRQWSEFWQLHYAYYGCYPSEGLFSAGSTAGDPAAAPATGATSHQPPPGADAGSLLPPPPAPPAPPPQLSAAAWACQPPHGAEAGSSSAQGAADAASSEDGSWVQVPTALLARYQQLEWEQWHRQYAEWQALWEQYKAYWADLYTQQQQGQPQ